MAQQYGSEIERIASQGAAASLRRSMEMQSLIRNYIRANARQQSLSFNTPGTAIKGGPPPGSLGKIGKGSGASGPIKPNAPIVSIRDGQGHTVQVNKSVADDFKAFLRALKRRGYDIDSIGGYANRNIAGTSTRSLHSYGLAIDINPSLNPVYYGSRRNMTTNFPRGIGKLARKYGITWGGNWHGSKKDPMHFSFPYFGTK